VTVLYSFALLVSAALLFLLEPMVGKFVLPLLGSAPEVWPTTVLFFQAALLAGYAFAHLTSRLPARRQALLQLGLLAVASALGELPEIEGLAAAATPDPTPATVEGGPWRAVADLDPRLLLIVDGKGRLVDCNMAFARVTGELRFQLVERSLADLVDPYDRAKAVAIFRGTPEQRLGWELNLRTAGSTGLFSFDCFPFRFRDRWLVACAGRAV